MRQLKRFLACGLVIALLVSLGIWLNLRVRPASARAASTSSQVAHHTVPQRTRGSGPTPGSCSPWRMMPNPAAPSGYTIILGGVATLSPQNAWAVGTITGKLPAPSTSIIEHWNGTQWAVVAGPMVSGSYDVVLAAISADSPSDIWAAGYYDTSQHGADYTLVEHWNGSQWSVLSSPDPGSINTLSSVAALSSTDVWAVGAYYANTTSTPLLAHWNGTQWTTFAAPGPSNASLNVNAVTAISSSDVWAVGNIQSAGAYTIHWNGTSWTYIPSSGSGSFLSLGGVAASATNDVWAVGSYGDPEVGDFHTIVIHWDGSQWTFPYSPNPGQYSNSLNAVTVISPTDAWAVGYTNDSAANGMLLEHWNGTVWSVVQAPAVSATGVNAVSADSSHDVWAVGQYVPNLSGTTGPALTMRYGGLAPATGRAIVCP